MPRQESHQHSAYFWLMFWLWLIVALGFALWVLGILTGTPPRFELPGRLV